MNLFSVSVVCWLPLTLFQDLSKFVLAWHIQIDSRESKFIGVFWFPLIPYEK